MKERPILFSTPMVQAILEGRKTQTRRVIKPQPDNEPYFAGKLNMWYAENKPKGLSDCPYGQPGDLLWVRETFSLTINEYVSHDTLSFLADNFHRDIRRPGIHLPEDDICEEGWYDAELSKELKWKPSIHMPKAAARIWLKVKDVRVERLQDISENDIIAEGVRIPVNGPNNVVFVLGEENSAISFLPERKEGEKYTQFQLLKAFWAELWCKVNGRKSWDANPWVWVVEFEVVSRCGKPIFESSRGNMLVEPYIPEGTTVNANIQ